MSYLPGQTPEDPENPYASPRAEHWQSGEPPRLPGLVHRDIDVGEVFGQSWRIFKDEIGVCIGAFLVAQVIIFAGNMASQFMMTAATSAGIKEVAIIGMIAVVGWFVSVAITIWISLGLLIFSLNLAAGRNASINDLFSGPKFVLPYLGATVLVVIGAGSVAILGFIPFFILLASGERDGGMLIGAGVLGGFAAVAVGLVTYVRLFPYGYLIVDRGAGAIESLSQSFAITRGNAISLIAIGLLSGIINMLGMLACCAGFYFFTGPYTTLIPAVAYLAMTGQYIADPMAPPEATLLKPLNPQDPEFA